MWKLKRGRSKNGGAAVAERPHPWQPAAIVDEFEGSDDELFAEIDSLSESYAQKPSRVAERELLALRHVAGVRALGGDGSEPHHPDPSSVTLPEGDPLPEFAPEDLTPEVVRAAILRDGCIFVRGLVPREDALAFAAQIDRSFAERERFLSGEAPAEGYYEEMVPAKAEYALDVRPWIREGGGVLAVDAPMPLAEMLAMFAKADLPELVGGYLGERPLISLQKTTLRKADPSVAGAWHQDGKFMGDVRALNLWLSLSRCGDESPGLDIVPRRLDHLVQAQTGEAMLDYQVSKELAEEAAGDKQVARPIFEPGDALLFDDLFLHATGSDPSMPKPRFAIESWFFGASAFPEEYGPLAV